MAQDQAIVSCAAGAWTQLTNADATTVTFQALDGPIYIRFTTDATTPTEDAGLLFKEGERIIHTNINVLTDLVGADRMWAKPAGNSARGTSVYIDHV